MSNTTPLFWEAAGVSLHTHAWQIRTFGGSRNKWAPKRGDDFVLPFHVGQYRAKKYRDARTLVLPMWVKGVTEDGPPDPDMSRVAKFHSNYRKLMSAFDADNRFNLTKRFYDNNTIRTAVARAEMLDTPEPQMIGPDACYIDIELRLAETYFFEAIGGSFGAGTTQIVGDAPTNRLVFTMGNGRVTLPDGNWIQYNGTGTAEINCETALAKKGSDYVNGLITRNNNFPHWPTLQPGSQTLTATGSMTFTYSAAWQ